MRPSPIRDLQLLRDGLTRLLRRPALFLGLSLLATGLSGLAPLARLRLKITVEPAFEALFLGLALLPMELYVLPRMMAYLDAATLGPAENPAAAWQETFEARWWRSTASRLLLSLIVGLGLLMCFVPGILALIALGWGPTRTLLRGDGILDGYRASARLMARSWPRAIFVVCTALLLDILAQYPLTRLLPGSTAPAVLLRSPWFWLEAFLSGALGIWFTSVLLCLFQAIERPQEASEEASEGPSGK